MHQKDGAPDTPARCGKAPPRPSEPRPDDAAHKKAATHASAERMAWESHVDALIAAFICGVWRAKKDEGRLGGVSSLRSGFATGREFSRSAL